ncbi:MAG: nucleotide exchange factor GrpE [Oscillospiraceae bacterium]|nr:nucleotide exchange factor GrpE [Oscillospiraceae bacterium]
MSKCSKPKDEEIKETTEETAEEVETSKEVETAEEVTETAEAPPAEKTECEKLTEELKAQKDSYLRLAAEYDNYRKRTQQEKLSIYADATAKAVEELLPLADSVTAALTNTSDDDPHKEGIELIGNQLKKSLEKLGVEAFGETGDTFDPTLHNAISRTDSEELPANSIAMVFQKGYKLKDKIIRPAMVQVANC